MKIGIFDSGIGGTTVMTAIKRLLPNEEYFYLADTANCPYGTKSDTELYPIVTHNVKQLQSWGARIIVVACNTATTRCITQLRTDFPELKFVGTEPAIKLAASSNAKNILVLATPGTIASERTQELARKHAQPHQRITLLPCPGLAETIEHYLDTDPTKIDAKLDELFGATTTPVIQSNPNSLSIPTTQSGPNSSSNPNSHSTPNSPNITNVSNPIPDTIVLGCTHYPLIIPQLQKHFPTAQFIDGGGGVARRVANLIANQQSAIKPLANP